MSLGVQLGLLSAVTCAFVTVVGFLLKHRGAVAAADVDFRHPVRSSIALFASPWYSLGIAVALGAWGFHVAALALAPISLVQSVIAGGLVLLTVVADRLFAQRVTRREWIGVGLTAAGLAFLAATLEGGGREAHSDFAAATLAAYAGGATVLACAVWAFARHSGHTASLLALSAGLMWGASDVSIKAASARVGEGVAAVAQPLSLVILVLSLVGLLVSARSLQLGPAVPVIAVTSAAANVVTIAAGPIVFAEPLPQDTLGLVVRVLAFALVIGAAALTPPPVATRPPAAVG